MCTVSFPHILVIVCIYSAHSVNMIAETKGIGQLSEIRIMAILISHLLQQLIEC